MRALISLAIAAMLYVGPAWAADTNDIYFYSSSSLFDFGFSKRACGPFPLPEIGIDTEESCAKVPTTYLYKLTENGAEKIKEVRELEDVYDETATRTTAPDGTVTEQLGLKITSGRSVDGNLGRGQRLTLSDVTNVFGQADTASTVSKTFATGLAAARRSNQDPIAVETPQIE